MLNQDEMLKELVEMEKDSVNDPSMSEWAPPMALVKIKDGNLRMRVDYRRLNSVSWADAYPMPRIDELIDRLGKAQYISIIICHVGIGKSQWEQLLQDKTAFVMMLCRFVTMTLFNQMDNERALRKRSHGH